MFCVFNQLPDGLSIDEPINDGILFFLALYFVNVQITLVLYRRRPNIFVILRLLSDYVYTQISKK